MAINWMNDLGAPLLVTAIDIGVEATAPQWDDYVAYGLPIATWLATAMGWVKGNTADFVKNVAIASTPTMANRIYRQVRGGVSSPARLSTRKVSRWPAPLVETPFGGARLV